MFPFAVCGFESGHTTAHIKAPLAFCLVNMLSLACAVLVSFTL
jgi:hypothetical protein